MEVQPYRWCQIVISDFGDNGFELNLGTTSVDDPTHKLNLLIEKHFTELSQRRPDETPKGTWVSFQGSDGSVSIKSLEEVQRPNAQP